MPLYEYYCADCHAKFSTLRPMSKADDPIACEHCAGPNTRRAISLFAAYSAGDGGTKTAVAGSSPCAGCASSTCSTCGYN